MKLGPKETIASFDVDAQYSFTPVCKEELPVPEGDRIVDELNQQAQFAQYRLGSKEAHPPHAIWQSTPEAPPLTPIVGENVDVRWPSHCIPGTKGFELIQGLPHPSQYDFYVWKGVEPDMHPYGSCYHDIKESVSTGVIEFLRANNVKTVIIGGLATDYCVKTTALQLLKAGFQIIINLGACRGLKKETTLTAIEEMRQQGALIIKSSQTLRTMKDD